MNPSNHYVLGVLLLLFIESSSYYLSQDLKLNRKMTLLHVSSISISHMKENHVSISSYLKKNSKHNIQIVSDDKIPPDSLTVKSLLFDIKDDTYLILLNINNTVDISKLSSYFNNEKYINLTERSKAETISSCKMGTVHPLSGAFAYPIPTIIDTELLQYDKFYAGSGHNCYSTFLNVDDILSVSFKNEVRILDISSIKTINDDNSKCIITLDKSNVKDKPFDLKSFINGVRKIATTSNIEKFNMILNEYDSLVDKNIIDITSDVHPLDQPTLSGKTALQLASWRGDPVIVQELLNRGCDINAYSTSLGSYGKTPIFYAITRCRDDVILMLLDKGANVKIVNNKGQTPLSLSINHCKITTIIAIENAEKLQIYNEWINYYESHSDGQKYGDLDPRFFDCDISCLEARVLKPTTINSRLIDFRDEISKKITEKKSSTIYDDFDMELLDNCSSDIKVVDAGSKELFTLPTPSQNGFVEIPCKLISKRHIGKTLMFGTIIPLSCNFIDEGTNKFCWILNEQERESPLACQIIIGKTVRDSVGEPLARKLCKGLKVGASIIIQGKYSPNGLPILQSKELAGINEVTLNDSKVSTYKPLNYNSQYENTIDIVVHRIKLLSSNIDNEKNEKTDDEYEIRDKRKHENVPSIVFTLETLGMLSKKHYSIILVNDSNSLNILVTSLQLLLHGSSIIGIDAEWRPCFNKNHRDMYPVSIIQLSFLDKIYIIDIQSMYDDDILITILNDSLHILSAENVKVLGLGIRYDLQRISQSYPRMNSFQLCSNIIDIQEFYNSIFKKKLDGSKNLAQGLSSISKQLFGIAVDKSQQLSSWHLRPLTEHQLVYASIDSCILEVIYNKLLEFE